MICFHRNPCFRALSFTFLLSLCASLPAHAQLMPPPAPIPDLPALRPPESITMQDPTTFPEVKMDFPIAAGPFEPTWDSIAKNYPGGPAWLREAKFGFWVHFGPQAAGQSGDWYARRLYQPGSPAYANHIRDFGHPSVTGYMDVLHTWNPTKLNPAKLVKIYHDAGARFLIVQGVHHDNFDNWNSTYQPWNSVNMGPKRDLLGEWSKAAHASGMRYGVAFHHEYTWWWYQPAFTSDTTGPKAGVPYDAARLTLADGKGKWWEGYDPRLLYGVNLLAYKSIVVRESSFVPSRASFQEHLDYAHWYATRWALRIMDVINKYDPDFIYTDGDSTQPFSGYKSGTGYKSDAMQRVIADYYNHTPATRGQGGHLQHRQVPREHQRHRQHRRKPHPQGHQDRSAVDRRTCAGRLVLSAGLRLQRPLAHPLYVGDRLPRRQLRRQHPAPARRLARPRSACKCSSRSAHG
jgi:alpha-L-fucosidase